jgi:hypothetical protein
VIVAVRAPAVKDSTAIAYILRSVSALRPLLGTQAVGAICRYPHIPDTEQTRDFITMERMRYALQLEMLERHAELDDDAAIEVLRAEFALAQNAGYFDDMTAEDFELGAISRTRPQEGVTRYAVDLLLEERSSQRDDAEVLAVVRRAFTDAMNASYFLKVCTSDHITVTLLARVPSTAQLSPAG